MNLNVASSHFDSQTVSYCVVRDVQELNYASSIENCILTYNSQEEYHK